MQKKFRIKKNEDFKRLIDARQFVVGDSFTIYFLKNDLNHSRFGISVGKKHGNAVTRNKIKRQIRMMVSQVFKYDIGLDYVIMIRKPYLTKSYADNLALMNQLAKKIMKRCEF